MLINYFLHLLQLQSFLVRFNPEWFTIWSTAGSLENLNASNFGLFSSVAKYNPCGQEPKFSVFYTQLLVLFSLICLKRRGGPKVSMQKNGIMVTLTQCCENCGANAFMWRSQPLVLGRYPARNILLSFAILIAGASVGTVLLVLKHLGICIYSAWTYFVHQSKFLFPAILTDWERYRTNLVNELKRKKGHLVWWWEIWLYGTFCKIWSIHNVLLRNC